MSISFSVGYRENLREGKAGSIRARGKRVKTLERFKLEARDSEIWLTQGTGLDSILGLRQWRARLPGASLNMFLGSSMVERAAVNR